MIVAYAQAAERQGLDVAVDGRQSTRTDTDFVALREKSVSLNLTKTPHEFDGGEVKFGHGVVRIELMATVDGQPRLSPVVVVIDAAELLRDPESASSLASTTIAAIGRKCATEILELALATGEQLARDARTIRRAAVVIAVVAIGVGVVALARSGASAGGLLSSSASWISREDYR